MKIYFAGSIRGGRDDQDLYFSIIEILKNYGQVLSEHVGNKELSSYGQTEMTDEEIYTKDVNWIKEADIIVAEVTTPSLGVGYELGFSEALDKKIILLFRNQDGKRLSAMLSGNKNFDCVYYDSVDELVLYFQKLFI